nr:hypothetical protein [Tanacetum cinerariifolium]GEZ53438.1 hypothetical protein [Tanacetum cinerariifolium]
MSISALMKCTAAIRQFAYYNTTDSFDEYLQMSEHTTRDALFFFNMCIIELYMPKYLRKPTSKDVVNIQQKHNNVHGFSGMLRSIDCMHWEWKNCPVSWQGQYCRGDKKYPTIMLEAGASQDLWIWHAFYGIAAKDIDSSAGCKCPLPSLGAIATTYIPSSMIIGHEREQARLSVSTRKRHCVSTAGRRTNEGPKKKQKFTSCPRSTDADAWRFVF